MSQLPKKAMILAAGLGKRMRPAAGDLPKPLVEVGGRALIDRALDRLIEAGVDSVIVNLHYKKEIIKAHLRKRNDVHIEFSDESDLLLDTGGGIAKALPFFEGEPFITHNSDSIWLEGMDSSIRRLGNHWDPDAMDALMLLAPTTTSLGYDGRGDFDMDALGRLLRRELSRVAAFAWAGVQIIHPRLFEDAPQPPFSTNVLWDRAIENGRLYGLRHEGVWMHVGSPDGLARAGELLSAA
jgi:MurNAc alpha-1-phosphate uridylyltransferase